jgi:lysine-ketoglutarate reductase/saccharopine dehydrogenase-like protein (TIGR00300 family)
VAKEDVEVSGHIIDSLILPKVLDEIRAGGGSFRIKQMSVGEDRHDASHALLEVSAPNENVLQEILAQIADHGAVPTAKEDCRLACADVDGVFPEGFYSSTNQRTEIRVEGRWIPVELQEMDCGIVYDKAKGTAACVAMSDVTAGMLLVVGHVGVRVFPPPRSEATQGFQFMNSAVSTEKPKGVAVRRIAAELARTRQEGGKTLVVAGPAVVHTGSGDAFCQLIRKGYIHRLFAGNALAAHDIEEALFGTSLGVNLQRGEILEAGHEHHLRAINRIRRAGSIPAAVEQGVLQRGIMYECVVNKVPFHLSGSIRDDGPLPDVQTDVLAAQREMRAAIRDVTYCLMIATTLHSIAVGNLLPAWVNVVCIDINPSTCIKLNDRGSFQTLGLVTDVEPFLRALVQEVELLEAGH